MVIIWLMILNNMIQMGTRGVQFFNTHWDDDSHVIRVRIVAKAVAYSGATKEIEDISYRWDNV